jgi:hypothetical protein
MSQFDEIYELGKKIAFELGPENEVDTLSRWMAHYIAELIKEVDNAVGDTKATKAKECVNTILDVWKVRHEWPNGKRPFENFEGIFRALQSLDPETKTPRYFRNAGSKPPGLEGRLTQYLEFIAGLDYTARTLIDYALGEAAALSKWPIKEWVEAAKGDAAEGDDIDVVRWIIRISDLSDGKELRDSQREILETRLERLKAFCASTDVVIKDLEQKISK